MSIAEREGAAIAYIDRCARRRRRHLRRRQRNIGRFVRFATLFAAGICAVWFSMAVI